MNTMFFDKGIFHVLQGTLQDNSFLSIQNEKTYDFRYFTQKNYIVFGCFQQKKKEIPSLKSLKQQR